MVLEIERKLRRYNHSIAGKVLIELYAQLLRVLSDGSERLPRDGLSTRAIGEGVIAIHCGHEAICAWIETERPSRDTMTYDVSPTLNAGGATSEQKLIEIREVPTPDLTFTVDCKQEGAGFEVPVEKWYANRRESLVVVPCNPDYVTLDYTLSSVEHLLYIQREGCSC